MLCLFLSLQWLLFSFSRNSVWSFRKYMTGEAPLPFLLGRPACRFRAQIPLPLHQRQTTQLFSSSRAFLFAALSSLVEFQLELEVELELKLELELYYSTPPRRRSSKPPTLKCYTPSNVTRPEKTRSSSCFLAVRLFRARNI